VNYYFLENTIVVGESETVDKVIIKSSTPIEDIKQIEILYILNMFDDEAEIFDEHKELFSIDYDERFVSADIKKEIKRQEFDVLKNYLYVWDLDEEQIPALQDKAKQIKLQLEA
jgi:hypothetical protein